MGILLPFALGIALNPTPIIATILLLTSSRGLIKGAVYLVGWLVALLALLSTMLLIVSSREYRRAPFTAQLTDWVILAFGITLLIMAWIQWRKRPEPDGEGMSLKWLRGIVQANWLMALSAGLFFGLFSVRNILLTGAAAMVIGESMLSADGGIWMGLLFTAIASLGIITPVAVVGTQGSRANAILTDWEYWLSSHNVTMNCIVLVALAVQLIVIALIGLI